MTLAELIAARDDLHARHNAAVEAYRAELARLDAAIDAAERAEQCARVERRVLARLDAAERTALRASVGRRMQTWPPHVLDLLRQPHPPPRYSTDWSPLSRRGLVRQHGVGTPARWTTDAVIAREILGVTA